MNNATRFNSFADFYPFYLNEHCNVISRRLHVIGTSCVLLLSLTSIVTQHWALLWLLPVLGYSFAWVGHYVFEKNRPATFKHPLYSLMGDFKMWWQVVTQQLNW
ncbi:DUF962 domain-containing protein [Solimicrobium silvestre]|uniref:Putative membrane protein n=1 Tax=Solimicrobium silvestre TaxID=2099400 RepID=A0A2S9H526_9BURK|nr:DUF962 domain-containing protein [Solimicrobium silvestre]PRC95090.1 putative membrane protein [Solimicrobium silvestre]